MLIGAIIDDGGNSSHGFSVAESHVILSITEGKRRILLCFERAHLAHIEVRDGIRVILIEVGTEVNELFESFLVGDFSDFYL